MPFRQRMSRNYRPRMAIVQSFKQQREETVSYAGLNANNQYVVVFGVAADALANDRKNVPVGAKVSSVFITVDFVSATGGATGTFSWMYTCLRAGQAIGTEFAATDASNWSNVGLSNARNQVIKSFTGIFGTEDAGVVRYNFQMKLPKHCQRIRQGDNHTITFNANNSGTLKIATRYKYYT